MMKIAILGAGPAGLSLAYHLSTHDISADIYDQNDKPGGLATSIQLWGNKVELGPHFLRKGGSYELDMLIKSVMAPDDYTVIDRNTKILFDDKKFNYPPNPMDMVKHLTFKHLCLAIMDMLKEKLSYRPSLDNAQDYLKKNLGNFIYRLFIKNYSEKLWGVSPAELHQSYAENLLPFSGAGALLKKLVTNLVSRKTATRLWDFPNGFDVLWQSTFNKISKDHTVYLGTKIHHIAHHNGRVESITSDIGTKYYDAVISTIPAFALLKMMGQPSSPSAPNFRHALLIYFLVSGDISHEQHCLYLYSKDYKAVRLTNFGSSLADEGKKILMLEYWLSDDELLQQSNFLELALMELQAINRAPLVISGQHSILLQKAYRVPNHQLVEEHTRQQDLLAGYENLIPLGRANSVNFNYGMEQAVSEGARLAEWLTQQSREAREAREARESMVPLNAG